MTPTQDITLGCYYLTAESARAAARRVEARLPLFGSKTEVVFAMADGAVKTHDRIRFENPDFGKKTDLRRRRQRRSSRRPSAA